MKGLDYSSPLDVDMIRKVRDDHGIEFVIRYILNLGSGSWKALTKEELQMLLAEGIAVGFVYERTAGRVKGGARQGSIDGAEAFQALSDLGVNRGVTIYVAVDYEAGEEDYSTIAQYIRAFGSQLGITHKVGVYGSGYVCEAMLDAGATTEAWQTVAWSDGKISDRIRLFQSSIDDATFLEGANVDHVESFGNEGFLSSKEEAATLTVEDANKIVALLGQLWGFVNNVNADSTEVKNEIHRLANVCRSASGQAVHE